MMQSTGRLTLPIAKDDKLIVFEEDTFKDDSEKQIYILSMKTEIVW